MIDLIERTCPGARQIPAWEGYWITPEGVVVSSKQNFLRMMNPSIQPNGRKGVRLGYGSSQKYYLVHDLMLLTFAGVDSRGKQVNYLDGDKWNLRIENLEVQERRREPEITSPVTPLHIADDADYPIFVSGVVPVARMDGPTIFTDESPDWREDEWAPFPLLPIYHVSQDGLVKSCKHGKEKHVKPAFITLRSKRDKPRQYKRVSLHVHGHPFHFYVAELVLTTFISPRPKGHYVEYKDGNTRDCGVMNLRWKYQIDPAHRKWVDESAKRRKEKLELAISESMQS